MDALRDKGYETPTPIQAQAIPHLLDGRDLLGIAQTGTGKTAAFALPMLDLLDENYKRPRAGRPRALILTPTRELASQINENFEGYGKHLNMRSAVIFGGVSQNPQVRALKQGLDILVATPGRLLDLMGQKHVSFEDVEIFVLDEADRMLDMGFLRDVRRVIERLPRRRQSLLFSATMPKDIATLARSILKDPVRVEVTPPSTTVERIKQHLCFVDKQDKSRLLKEILKDESIKRVLVFSRTKHGANRIAGVLESAGIHAAAIHGNKSQGARERALASFRAGEIRVLVATDIAARGIDVRDITHVINFDLPNEPESYVHRIGRTARAGREGVAISFCDPSERGDLRDIERLTGQEIERMTVELPPGRGQSMERPGARRGGGGRSGGGRAGRSGGSGRSSSSGGGGRGRGRRSSGGGSSGGSSAGGTSSKGRSRNRRRGRGTSAPPR
ncbi:MAG: DEAD/DEAH box helicase [Planctomycetota bacterium]|nr:DEAD/DEAH box helicase [Planctomycetota bacterium]